MKNGILIGLVACGLFAGTAYAGKAERDYKVEVEKTITTSEKEFKDSCGCGLKFNVKWDLFKTTDQMAQAKNIASSLGEGSKTYCNDEGSKKAMCAMKSFEITLGKESKFEFSGGKGVATTDGNSYVHFDMISREVDK